MSNSIGGVIPLPSESLAYSSFDWQNGFDVPENLLKASMIASKISGVEDHEDAFRKIGVGLSNRGLYGATRALATHIFRYEVDRTGMLRDMMFEMIKAGRLEELVALAKEITEKEVCAAVVKELVKIGLFEIAFTIADLIPDSGPYRGRAFEDIARGLSKIGRFDEAIAAAECIPPSSPLKDGTFALIAQALIEQGQLDKALEISTRFTESCISYKRGKVVEAVAKAFSSAHEFQRAIELAEGLPFQETSLRANSFLQIAKDLAAAGLIAEAEEIVTVRIRGCESALSRDTFFEGIALSLAPHHYEKAIEFVNRIEDSRKDWVLYSLLSQMIRNNLFDEAVNLAGSLEEEKRVVRIASELIEAGQIEQASFIARRLTDAYKILVAEALEKAGQRGAAKDLYDTLADRSWIDRRRSVEGPVQAGLFEEALAIAEKKSDDEKKLAYQYIAKEMVKQHKIHEALALVQEKLKHGTERDETLKYIVQEVVQIGHSDDDIEAVKAVRFDAFEDDFVIRMFKEQRLVRKVLTEAVYKAANETCADRTAFLPDAVRLFKEKKFNQEISTLVEGDWGSCDCETRVDVVMSIAGKLLLEKGRLKNAANIAKKIRYQHSWRSAIYESIAAKTVAEGQIDTIVAEAMEQKNSQLRDKVLLEVVKKIIGE